MDGQLHESFKEACRARGLLQDDREWLLCLQEAAHFAMGYQLRCLFVVILIHCSPVDPHRLWDATKHHLCDDLQHHLIHTLHIPQPTQEQVYDYGLYLIDQELQQHGKSLQIFPTMPRPQHNWGVQQGNLLINEQLAYDVQEQQQIVDTGLPTLNVQQRDLYHAVMNSVHSSLGSTFFLHSGGGCGKTYLAKLIAAGVHATRNIVLCVASTGLASLLFPGGCTAHSHFKIPIHCYEKSTCSIKKNDATHQLLNETSLIIWDESASQNHYVIEAVDRTLRDLLNQPNRPFGGITVLFSGDFRQTLPVIQHGSRELIVPSTLTHSNLWPIMAVHYLHQNMCLGQDPESDDWAQQLLHIGVTDGDIVLPQHMHCGDTMDSLIQALYSQLLAQNQNLPDRYFLDRTILCPRNDQVHEINTSILDSVAPQEKTTYLSADTISDAEYEYIQPEVLHTINPSGFPLHKLELKIGAPLMLLRNLDPLQGLCNCTRLRLLRSTQRVLECRVLTENGDGNVVLIPRMALDSGLEDSPVPFRRFQFPVHLVYAMTINKSQRQTLKHVGLNLRSPVFSHGQLYVALSCCTHPRNIKILFPIDQEDSKAANIVWTEVCRNLQL